MSTLLFSNYQESLDFLLMCYKEADQGSQRLGQAIVNNIPDYKEYDRIMNVVNDGKLYNTRSKLEAEDLFWSFLANMEITDE